MFILDDLIAAEIAAATAGAETAAAAATAAEAAAAAEAASAASAGIGAADAAAAGATAAGAGAAGAGTAAGLGAVPTTAQAGQLAATGVEPVARGLAVQGSAPAAQSAADGIATGATGATRGMTAQGPAPADLPKFGGMGQSPTGAVVSAPTPIGGEGVFKGITPPAGLEMSTAASPPPTFFDKAAQFAKQNPGTAITGGILGLQALDRMTSRDGGPPGYTPGPLDRYRLSPNFRGSTADPQQYQYTPKTYNYSNGGPINNPNTVYPLSHVKTSDYSMGLTDPATIRMARGGDPGSVMLSTYEKMMQSQPKQDYVPGDVPGTPRGVGIVQDSDPDTRNLDPFRASQVRMAKLKKRVGMSADKMPAQTSLGSMNVGIGKKDDTQYQELAKGGVADGAGLGGYAAGGNPRLLRGPGDGMSDNIPATINNRQPARLADGEFVVPADVVSHLGNGSTEAGAKRLHKMMTDVRKARTGNPKQGKQIKAQNYIPV